MATLAAEFIDVEAEIVTVKAGRLEIDVNGASHGTVKLDGKELPVRYLSLECEVGEPTKVLLELVP